MLFTVAEVNAARQRKYGKHLQYRTAGQILNESAQAKPTNAHFDIFLSHSYSDAQVDKDTLLGFKAILEEFAYEVYVDWITDQQLDRTKVTEATAKLLRVRMSHSTCLLFVTSKNSTNSKWMPWELGYKDGQTAIDSNLGKVAILPLIQSGRQRKYEGQEYLGIYPYVDHSNNTFGRERLWVRESPDRYVVFHEWLKGEQPHEH